MPIALIWSFITGPIGRWIVVAVAIAGLCGGSYWKGYNTAEAIQLGKQAEQRVAYEADIAKKAAVINDQNAAYEKLKQERKEEQAGLQSKFDRDLAAAGRKPAMCSAPKDITDDLNAIIGATKRGSK
jgi:hypothetical protein